MPVTRAGGFVTAVDGTIWTPLLGRLRTAERSARFRSSLDLGVMTTPPVITTAIAADGTLTRTFLVNGTQDSAFRFRGGPAYLVSAVYYRFKAMTLPDSGTQQNNGWAVEFYSDAPKLQVQILCSGSTNGVQVEVDDQLIAAAPTAQPAGSGQGYIVLDWTAVRKVRKYRFEGDSSTGFRGVMVGPTSSVWAAQPAREITACFVGDSVDAQTGVTSPNGGWNISAGKLLGWSNVVQVALGGTGFVAVGAHNSTFGDSFRVADVQANAPDVIVIGASSNDVSGAPLRAAMIATLQAHRAANPNALFIVHGVWGGASGPSGGNLNAEADMLTAFNTWADPNSFYIPVSNDPTGIAWVYGTGHVGATNNSGNSDVYVNAADIIHPSQAGHDYYARRFANAVREKVLGVRA